MSHGTHQEETLSEDSNLLQIKEKIASILIRSFPVSRSVLFSIYDLSKFLVLILYEVPTLPHFVHCL